MPFQAPNLIACLESGVIIETKDFQSGITSWEPLPSISWNFNMHEPPPSYNTFDRWFSPYARAIINQILEKSTFPLL